MTTSTYNDSTAAAARPTSGPPPTATTHPHASAPQTTASRFIVLLLCLALTLSTAAYGTVHAWALLFFALGAGLVVALWAVDAWRTGTLRLSRNVLQLPLAGLGLLGLVQLLPRGGGNSGAGLPVAPVQALSLDPYATRFVVLQLGALLIYFAATLVFIDSPRRLRLLVRVIIVFGFLVGLFGLLQHFVSPDQIYWLRTPNQGNPFGPFINGHHFASFMALTLALPLGLLFTGAVEREQRFLYGFAIAIMAIALVVTGSRGGLISFACEVLFLFVLGGTARHRQGRVDEDDEPAAGGRGRALMQSALARVGLGFALVLALLLSALMFGGERSLSRFVGTVNSDDPTTGRAQFWRGTLDVIKDHPLTGAGLGAFGVAYTRHDPLNGTWRLEQAHNDYLQILADAGLVGGALALLFVVALFWQGFARFGAPDKFRRGVAAGALAGCAAVLVHSFFDFPLHITSIALLFLTLAALATTDSRVVAESHPRHRRRRQWAHPTIEQRAPAASSGPGT